MTTTTTDLKASIVYASEDLLRAMGNAESASIPMGDKRILIGPPSELARMLGYSAMPDSERLAWQLAHFLHATGTAPHLKADHASAEWKLFMAGCRCAELYAAPAPEPARVFELIASARRQLQSALNAVSAEDRRDYIQWADQDLESAGKLEDAATPAPQCVLPSGCLDDMLPAPVAALAPQSAIPEGWKLVPIEPTENMLDAIEDAAKAECKVEWDSCLGSNLHFGDAENVYRDLLAAAPALPATPGKEQDQ